VHHSLRDIHGKSWILGKGCVALSGPDGISRTHCDQSTSPSFAVFTGTLLVVVQLACALRMKNIRL
jgi:hypothetical protein